MNGVKILNVRFPNQDQQNNDKIEKFKNTLETDIPNWDIDMTIDELNASLKDAKALMNQEAGLNNLPLRSFSPKHPLCWSFLMVTQIQACSQHQAGQAINTPYFVVQDPAKKEFFLFGDPWWYKTNDVVKGQWTNIKEPPQESKTSGTTRKKGKSKPGCEPAGGTRQQPGKWQIASLQPLRRSS